VGRFGAVDWAAMESVTSSQAKLLATIEPLLEGFAARAAGHDREGSFPFENFEGLREVGYVKAAVPRELGGWGHGLGDVLRAQMAIARADGSTAYSIGMHQITVGREVSAESWPAEVRERIFREVASEGAWINSIASEPELGSPQGGGRPATTLTPDGAGHWRLNGRKIFSTLAPVLTYFVTYAAIEDGSGEVCRVAVRRGAPGLRVETTWDGVGLRASGSDDVVYEDVPVADEDILVRSRQGGTSQSLGDFSWFALLVGGANLGIAEAARNYAVRFAQERKPTGYAEPIASIPYIRQEIARVDQSLMAARALMFEVADAWDNDPTLRGGPLAAKTAAAKLLATDTAVQVVDRSMRVVGGASLHRSEPLERYYRDVRGGLANPPIEPRALEMIARAALDGE